MLAGILRLDGIFGDCTLGEPGINELVLVLVTLSFCSLFKKETDVRELEFSVLFDAGLDVFVVVVRGELELEDDEARLDKLLLLLRDEFMVSVEPGLLK